VHARSIRASFAIGLAAALSFAAPAGAAGAAPASNSAPQPVRAQSLSWVSPQDGFALGTAACGQADCTQALGTSDGGRTWTALGAIGAPITLEQPSGVTEVRFADELHGWAFDPALWRTGDGGLTWTKERTPGGRAVLALAADAQVAYAVVSGCRFGQPLSNCTHPTTLWRAAPGQSSWSRVQMTLPETSQAILALDGSVAYLVVPAALVAARGAAAPDVLEVTVDGQRWSARPDPCDPSQGETLTSIAPISDQKVALLCQGNIGFGKAHKAVLRSDDTAKTTRPAGLMPDLGITTQLAAAPNGVLVAASYSIGSWIYRNAGGQDWTTSVDFGDLGQGWNDVSFTTNQVGYVIHGPAACCGDHGPGELWVTRDAGLTWGPA
jgi:hypothetical protein